MANGSFRPVCDVTINAPVMSPKSMNGTRQKRTRPTGSHTARFHEKFMIRDIFQIGCGTASIISLAIAIHGWMKPAPLCRQYVRSCALHCQVSYFMTSSIHRTGGRPRLLLPVYGDQSLVRLLHLMSLKRAKWPAHLHFILPTYCRISCTSVFLIIPWNK